MGITLLSNRRVSSEGDERGLGNNSINSVYWSHSDSGVTKIDNELIVKYIPMTWIFVLSLNCKYMTCCCVNDYVSLFRPSQEVPFLEFMRNLVLV